MSAVESRPGYASVLMLFSGDFAAQVGVERNQPLRRRDERHDHDAQEQKREQPLNLCRPLGPVTRHEILRPLSASA
jgi:hypothetical protein